MDDNECSFNCCICRKEFYSTKWLLHHLRDHIREGHEVDCPYGECPKKYKVITSFSSHVQRCHGSKNVELSNHIDLTNSTNADCISSNLSQTDFEFDEMPSLNLTIESAKVFFLLENKCFLPTSTVQKIFNETKKLNHKIAEHCKVQLVNILKNYCSTNVIDQVVTAYDERNSEYDQSLLRNGYMRNIFYSKNFVRVSPVAYNINISSEQTGTYHYVPILKTIQFMFLDPIVKSNFAFQERSPFDYFDICDGNVYKSNHFFNSGNKVQIILYQDEFEVANPLGSARCKHKLLAVYYKLGNLHPQFRSKVHPIQLVLLCKQQYVNVNNHRELFQPLINDLKVLESAGIDLGFSEKVLGSVVCITGDNLGSHWLGGFTTNFSTAKYVCRYCSLSQDDFIASPLCKKSMRNKLSNKTNVLTNTECLHDSTKGVKFSSCFNELNYFHVCNPGLPPCIAHDLFEGIVQSDMMLFIKYFINEHWFTLEFLNHRIRTILYCRQDSTSKPPVISNLTKRVLGGNASQNWCFLRLFPVFVINKVVNECDPVWQCMLTLRSIVEICVAPALSHDIIVELKLLIDKYIIERRRLFADVKLRPKHHYLTHYPWLILQFGPLIHMSTLRFESKHSYFKRIIRCKKNFINITHSLTEQHQMLQSALLAGGGLFQSDKSDIVMSSRDNITPKITMLLTEKGLKLARCSFFRTMELTCIRYSSNDYIVLEKCNNQITVGKILMLVKESTQIYFIVSKKTAIFNSNIGLYFFNPNLSSDLNCVSIHQIYFNFPVSCYTSHRVCYIVRKQYF